MKKKKKITIIDDDSDLRNLLLVVLRFYNFEVEIFSSGEEFLARHKESSPKDFPDLYIIDINLGGINGIDLCRNLKTSPVTKSVPVIIISAHPEIEKLAKDVCADESLAKPFSQKILKDVISKYV